MIEVLHITVHMGGGAGKAIAETALYGKKHGYYNSTIISLEHTEKNRFTELCRAHSIKIIDAPMQGMIVEEIKRADIVQLNWWHHPLMARFLADFPSVPLRLILWSHISGCSYPAIPFAFVKKFHRVFFTSKYSFDNPYFTKGQREELEQFGSLVYGSGDFAGIQPLKKGFHSGDGFRILYVGTMSYSKMSPEFAHLCSLINIPDVRFLLAGDLENQARIISDAEKYHILDKLSFMGYVVDPYMELSRADVFGYPLNPYHYGTTENALLEAMVMEVPVVAFRQCSEQYTIKHMETGLLASDNTEYKECIEYLYANPQERKRIGKNARQYVQKEYSMEEKNRRIMNAYESVLSMPERIIEFQSIFGSAPYQWFLSCLGNDYSLFYQAIEGMKKNQMKVSRKNEELIRNCREILREPSKSSIRQFAKYYPEDIYLRKLKEIIG